MAAGCNGEHRRFQFIATVRYLVATVITVVTVAVVVMVIAVVNRPVKMGLSSSIYVQANDWWQELANITPPHAVAPSYRYGPAESVEIYYVLAADNPSGRGEVECSINAIRLIDTRNMTEFVWYQPPRNEAKSSFSFDLPPHSSHRYVRWTTLWDQTVLKYLYNNHGQDKSGFSVLLVVQAAYKTPAHSEKNVTYYCSPVTFHPLIYSDVGSVTCMTAEEMGYTPKFETRCEVC
jgi:hypothetical protein